MGVVGAPEHDRRGWVYRFHLGETSVRGSGSFEVRRGRTRLARVLCLLLHLPLEGSEVPVHVEVQRYDRCEVWTRVMGERAYVSRHERHGELTTERIGPLALRFRVLVDGEGIGYEQEKAMLRVGALTLPLPARACPRVSARAVSCGDAAFFVRVDVTALHKVPLFSYWGMVKEA